ncbi:hypothetical protein IKF57_01010 [Candidatus Saccharibacteria bacterium]|nr:hypothetical protein [Candidatus Saccharibacteria bacterium]
MSDLCGIYEKIMMDEEWYEWMDKIKKLSASEAHGENKELLADHGMRHAMRVAEYAVDFIDECYQYFGEDGVKKFHAFGHEEDFYFTAIAALLHDIGIVDGRENHTERSVEMAKKYLQKYDISSYEIPVITGAIGCHSDGLGLVNLVDAALIMGDKMDITRSRSLAFYDESLLPKLSPAQKELHNIKRVNYFIDEEYGHGVLEWGVMKASDDVDFNSQVDNLLQTLSDEWPKCINIPNSITSDFLKLEFTFIVDDVT